MGKMLNFQEITAETDNRNTKQRKNGFNDVVKQRDGARCFRQLVKPRRNAEVALRVTIDRVFFFSSVRKNRFSNGRDEVESRTFHSSNRNPIERKLILDATKSFIETGSLSRVEDRFLDEK